MKKRLLFILLCLIHLQFIQAQSPGGIAFTSFNTDGNDDFSFVLLQEATAGLSIFFNENEWNGTGFNNANEGTLEWENTTGATIPAGTVITISNASLSSRSADIGGLTLISGSFNLGGSDEVLYAYTGTATTPVVFLAAISNEAYSPTVGSLTGTGLVEGVTAANIDGDIDVATLIGTIDCTGSSLEGCAALINNVMIGTNWATQTGSNDQSNDGTFPDVPDDIAPSSSFTIPTTYGALPVELQIFTAIVNNKKPLLSWQTSQEINNDYFLVQHSNNGRDFNNIGKVQGAGNSEILLDYEFVHTTPVSGINYYRLQQFDFDGASSYSAIVTVRMEEVNQVAIYPNPVTDELIIAFSSEMQDNISAEIINQTGSIVAQQVLAAKTVMQTMNTADLVSGIYILRIINGNEITTTRFVKK